MSNEAVKQVEELRATVNETENSLNDVLSGEQATLSEEAVNQMLIEAKKRRITQCAQEMNAVMEKYQCKLVPVTIIVNGEISQKVEVVTAA
jgi:hypothetical protein